MDQLISIKNCRIENSRAAVIPRLDWTFEEGQAWLVIGPNGGGKADFVNALSGMKDLKIVANDGGSQPAGGENHLPGARFSSVFGDSVEIVSLERAARLIEEERLNDESEFVEGGVDIGRTGRVFIAEGICGTIKKNAPLPEEAKRLESYPAIKLCGIEKILDRGLKYMSTGEIRRTLLARALISGKKLLILSDPFAGLDIQSRTILLEFFNTITAKQLNAAPSNPAGSPSGEPASPANASASSPAGSAYPHVILGMERWHEIPDAITHVLEFKDKKITFCGPRADYEKLMEDRAAENNQKNDDAKAKLTDDFTQTLAETSVLREVSPADEKVVANETSRPADQTQGAAAASRVSENQNPLIEMNHVNVGWDDHRVLIDLNWRLMPGQHWLIQGPNGSGKTTFLELITGDNMQVFCNDVRLFGARRGSGESIWDIKKQLGIVSYRLHVEYRMVGGTSLLNVIVSGFRDSIGLYGAATDVEAAAAKKWLKLGGFEGREDESFASLSYGEQRAILILRSAVKTPKVLILDEPCHGLDESYREKILHLLELIGEGGTTTMLHVTHDPGEVLACEHHVLQLCPNESPMYKIIER